MRRRKLRLPVLTVRTLLLVCGALVVVCVGVGLAMRTMRTTGLPWSSFPSW